MKCHILSSLIAIIPVYRFPCCTIFDKNKISLSVSEQHRVKIILHIMHMPTLKTRNQFEEFKLLLQKIISQSVIYKGNVSHKI